MTAGSASGAPHMWLLATADDFAAADPDMPVATTNCVDCRALSDIYKQAAKNAEERQELAQQRVFAMLGAVSSFYFKPHEPEEPFGPAIQFGDRRTAQPSDFVGAPAITLAGQVECFRNPAIRARVADLVWLLDRKQASAASAAIDAYVELVISVCNGDKNFRDGENAIDSVEIAEHLRRAVQIGKAIGWERENAKRLRDLIASVRATAATQGKRGNFRRLATLDLDYGISEPSVIAAEAEALAKAESDLHIRHALLHLAGRAHRRAKAQADCDRCLLEAAECLASIAIGGAELAMFQTHWLEQAIGEMQRLPSTKERRRQLKHQLVDAQSRIADEMSHFSHTEDFSDIVTAVRAAVSGKPLMQALRALALVTVAPDPQQLEKEAREMIAAHPLSSIFAATTYDATGKPVHRDKGMDGSENEGVQRKIAENERFRRSAVAQGYITNARLAIAREHYVGEDAVGLICSHSPFVPADRTALFATGILDFFNGNMIPALHVLMPQLENSLRHVLRLQGHDPTKLNEDMTQEDVGLSVLLDKFREELEAIFGAHMVADINNVFNFRGGPNLRNRIAHGLVPNDEPFGDDAVYACWLIFSLVCIPLLPHWEQLVALHVRDQG